VALFCLAWSPDTHLLVGGSADASLWLWELTPGGGTLRLKGHRDAILGVSFRPDGRLLASASADGTVRLWDLHRRAEVEQLPHPHTVCALHFTPDGQTLVAACEDGRIYVWGGTGHPASQILAGPLPPSCLALSPDQRWLAWGLEPNALVLHDWVRQHSHPPLEGDKGAVLSLSFSPDSRILAAGSASGQVFFWDVRERRLAHAASLHQEAVTSLAFVPAFQQEGSWMLATGGEDGHACLWWVEPVG
jgi:WD40 repeat protein